MEKLTTLFRKPVPVQQALRAIEECSPKGKTESVPLFEARGRTLARTFTAPFAVPPFDKSPYDGFAVASTSLERASREQPIQLPIQATQGAGTVVERLLPGHAVRIMTGARIPDGADAVVMMELVRAEDDTVTFKRPVKDANIVYTGEDIACGGELLKAGTVLSPGAIAVLATFGVAEVEVIVRPRLTVFATGSELVEPGEFRPDGKIYNSNAYMIVAQLEALGADVYYGGILPDDFETLRERVAKALVDSDAIVTTGGVSVGDFDFLPDLYADFEADVLFNKVGMRPGSVTTIASLGPKVLFGLSGNPSACFVGVELFVAAYLRTWFDQETRGEVEARLACDFKKANPFDRFVRARLALDDEGSVIVTPTGRDKSGIVSSLPDCNALIHLPGGTRGFEKGERVRCVVLNP